MFPRSQFFYDPDGVTQCYQFADFVAGWCRIWATTPPTGRIRLFPCFWSRWPRAPIRAIFL